MKYLIIPLLFLVGCSNSPGTFEAKVTKVWYREFSPDTGIDVYSEKYGNITIYNSSYYARAHSRDSVVIGCSETKGIFAPHNCAILNLTPEQAK